MTKMEYTELLKVAIESLRQQEESLTAQAKNCADKRASKCRELIALTAPFQVGQRISTRKGEIEVVRLEPARYFSRTHPEDFEVYGRLVLASGNLHKTERRVYDWDLPEQRKGRAS